MANVLQIMDGNYYWLTPHEQETLDRNIDFYCALDHGKRKPATSAQLHFVLVCRGKATPQTAHEYLYMRYRSMEEAKGTFRLRTTRSKVDFKKVHTEGHDKIPKKMKITKDMKRIERERISRILLGKKKK